LSIAELQFSHTTISYITAGIMVILQNVFLAYDGLAVNVAKSVTVFKATVYPKGEHPHEMVRDPRQNI